MCRNGIFLSCAVLLLVQCAFADPDIPADAPPAAMPVVNASLAANLSSVGSLSTSKSALESPASAPAVPDAAHNGSQVAAAIAGMAVPQSSPVAQQPRLGLPSSFENQRAKQPPTVVKQDFHECYVCNSFEDSNKCKRAENLQKVTCPGGNPSGPRVCHHIVGTHTNNKKVEKNVVFAGCGYASPVNLPEIAEPIHSTFQGHDIKCTPFEFVHNDQGSGKQSNQAIKFIGHSCNCDGVLCNSHSEFSKYFSPNSGIATKSTSFLSVISSVFCVVMFSVALRA